MSCSVRRRSWPRRKAGGRTDPSFGAIAARNPYGNAKRLLATGAGGHSRVDVNKVVRSFWIYGALVKVQERDDQRREARLGRLTA